MILSLKNYKSNLSQMLIKKAEKNSVRECDEIETGHFQAYVDEKTTTFDVTIVFNSNGEVLEHSCDCGEDPHFCRHKTALLAFVARGNKKATQVKNSKKTSKLEILVNDADPEKLKAWLKEILAKNRELELAFMLSFSEEQRCYTPAEIRNLTLGAVSAVIKKRMKAETNEVAKIVDLWTGIHEPFINQYISRATDKQAFLNFDAVIMGCAEIQSKVNTTSIKFGRYVKGVLEKVALALQYLQEEEAWDLATGYFADHVQGDKYRVNINYVVLLTSVLDASTMARRERLINKLVKEYEKNMPRAVFDGDKYTRLLFDLVNKNDLFGRYYEVFKPIRFDNDYNDELINLLITDGHLELAEQYCKEQIQANFREDYDLLYLQYLKEIYILQKDEKKLVSVLKETFTETFDFDEFLFIYKRIEVEEEKKKWRTKVTTKAKNAAYGNTSARTFYFRLMDYEGKYRKMIEFIPLGASFDIVTIYAEKMLLTDRFAFLKEIFDMPTPHLWMEEDTTSKKEDNACFPVLLDILRRHCDKATIQAVINNVERSYLYTPNDFIDFMKQSLQSGGWK